MTAIAAAAAALIALPRPVLFFDTCDLLEIVQCLPEQRVDKMKRVPVMLNAMGNDPSRLQLVTSFVVQHEWTQTIDDKESDARRYLKEFDESIQSIHRAWDNVNQSLSAPLPAYAGLPDLVQILRDIAKRVLDSAVVLNRDPACNERALDRVMNKRRPAHNNEVKDSVHLEHVLELTRHLQLPAYSERRLFVSSDRKAYGADKSVGTGLHPELHAEFAPLGLEFFPHLDAALGSLGF